MTEFMDPDHEALGDAAGDLTDPNLDTTAVNAAAAGSTGANWDPRPPGTTDPEPDAEADTDAKGGSN